MVTIFILTFMRSYLPSNTGLSDIKLLQLLRFGTHVAINYGKEPRIQDNAGWRPAVKNKKHRSGNKQSFRY